MRKGSSTEASGSTHGCVSARINDDASPTRFKVDGIVGLNAAAFAPTAKACGATKPSATETTNKTVAVKVQKTVRFVIVVLAVAVGGQLTSQSGNPRRNARNVSERMDRVMNPQRLVIAKKQAGESWLCRPQADEGYKALCPEDEALGRPP